MLTVYGVTVLTFMMLMYALEGRDRKFVLAFALGCALSSSYGFASGAWPFGGNRGDLVLSSPFTATSGGPLLSPMRRGDTPWAPTEPVTTITTPSSARTSLTSRSRPSGPPTASICPGSASSTLCLSTASLPTQALSLVPVLLTAVRRGPGPGRHLRHNVRPPGDGRTLTLVPVDPDDGTAEPWLYPTCYCYERQVVERWVASASLAGRPIPWFHHARPGGCSPSLLEALPPPEFLNQLTGPTLADGFELSWRPR